MLEDDGSFQTADIHILPPPTHELTDEDSGSEEEDMSYDNLSGRQLEQPAIVTLIRSERRQVIDRAVDSDMVIACYSNFITTHHNKDFLFEYMCYTYFII
jgi:hypothetical protein